MMSDILTVLLYLVTELGVPEMLTHSEGENYVFVLFNSYFQSAFYLIPY